MSATDRLLQSNAAHAGSGRREALHAPPALGVAVVACMDARMDVFRILGLAEGDAHVIRNAGGVVTEDALRSLVISQRLLGTNEIVLIHHTDCGMLTFSDDEVRAKIAEDVGFKPLFALQAFTDLDEDVREGMRRILASPFIPEKGSVRGFVYDVATGALREITL